MIWMINCSFNYSRNSVMRDKCYHSNSKIVWTDRLFDTAKFQPTIPVTINNNGKIISCPQHL